MAVTVFGGWRNGRGLGKNRKEGRKGAGQEGDLDLLSLKDSRGKGDG